MRTGIGFDIHRIEPSPLPGQLMLGGIQIPCEWKLIAHSDGDVVLHALTDAILGALALGDIGQLFSDKDPKNKGRNSLEFLATAKQMAAEKGYCVDHLDINVFAEQPKIAPHSLGIRQKIAAALEIELNRVSLKAKTMEGLGPIGEKVAIAAQAIVQMREIAPNSR